MLKNVGFKEIFQGKNAFGIDRIFSVWDKNYCKKCPISWHNN